VIWFGYIARVGRKGIIFLAQMNYNQPSQRLEDREEESGPMRPKARVLAQHGGPPGWLEESNPAGVILCVRDGPYRLAFPYSTSCPDRSCPVAS
jgi:hypothetical protein